MDITVVVGASAEVSSPGFGLQPQKRLRFIAADVSVEGSNFNLQPYWVMRFGLGSVAVTAPSFNIKVLNPRTTFIPAETEVTAPGFASAPRARGALPTLRPTSRRFVPPEFANTRGTSEAGSSSYRLWASQAAEARLELVFENISDAESELFLKSYDQAKGSVLPLQLPADLFAGLQGDLRGLVETPGEDLEWFYDKPPVVTSVIAGVSTVNVQLVAKRLLDDKKLPEAIFTPCPVETTPVDMSVCDASPELDCLPYVCTPPKTLKTWVAHHSQWANYMNTIPRVHSYDNDWGGMSETGGCCFDKDGNVYGMAMHYNDIDDVMQSIAPLSFCKISNDGELLWEYSVAIFSTQSYRDSIYGGGMREFNDEYIVATAGDRNETKQYLWLLPKDGDFTKLRTFSIAGFYRSCLDVDKREGTLVIANEGIVIKLKLKRTELPGGEVKEEFETVWAIGYSFPDALPPGNSPSVFVNVGSSDIIVTSFSRMVCFSPTGGYKWSNFVTADASAMNTNAYNFASDEAGNWYTSYTTRTLVPAGEGYNSFSPVVPWLIKISRVGGPIKSMVLTEGNISNYCALYYIVVSDDNRLYWIGEGGNSVAWGLKVHEFDATTLEWIRGWNGMPQEFDDLDLMGFMDNYAALTTVEWCSKTKELLCGNYVSKGPRLNSTDVPIHATYWKIRVDEEEITSSYNHPLTNRATSVVIYGRLAEITYNSGDFGDLETTGAINPVDSLYKDDLDVRGITTNIKIAGTWNGPSAELYKIPKREVDRLWISSFAYGLVVNIFPSPTVPTLVDPGPIELAQTNLTPFLPEDPMSPFNVRPTVAVHRSTGFTEDFPDDNEVIALLRLDGSIPKDGTQKTCEKTGTRWTGNAGLVQVRDKFVDNSWRVASAYPTQGDHPRYNLKYAKEFTIELDLYLDSDLTPNSRDEPLIHWGGLLIYIRYEKDPRWGSYAMIFGYDAQGNWLGLTPDLGIPYDNWFTLTVTCSAVDGWGFIRASMDPVRQQVPGYSGWVIPGDEQYEGYGFKVMPSSTRIAIGTTTGPVDDYYLESGASFTGGYFTKFRVSAKAVYHQHGELPAPFDFPLVTLDERLFAIGGEPGPAPSPSAASTVSVLTFQGEAGSTDFTDLGTATWTSVGGVITNNWAAVGVSGLDTTLGGIRSFDFPTLKLPLFIEGVFETITDPWGDQVLLEIVSGTFNTRIILNYADSETTFPFTYWVGEYTTATIALVIKTDTEYGYGGTHVAVVNGPGVPVGEKVTFAVQIGADLGVEIFINGISLGVSNKFSLVTNQYTFAAPTTVTIGGSYTYPNMFWKGFIGAIRIGTQLLYSGNYALPVVFDNVLPAYTPPTSTADPFTYDDVVSLVEFTGPSGSKTVYDTKDPFIKWRMTGGGQISDTHIVGGQNMFWTGTSIGSLYSSPLPLRNEDEWQIEFYAWFTGNLPRNDQTLVLFNDYYSIRMNSLNQPYFFFGSGLSDTPAAAIPFNQLVHLALGKTATNNLTFHVDGQLSNTLDATTVYLGNPILQFCYNYVSTTLYLRDAYIGPIRVSKKLIYTGTSFTPPSPPFPTS